MRTIRRQAFTLVELMVAIAIIAILMGLLTGAVMTARYKAGITALKVETTAIGQAIEDYHLKYGDYPPDFSNWNVVERHYRKIFPRIAQSEIDLLRDYLFDTPATGPPIFDAVQIDRAEALVFTLGGYGSDPVNPLTNGGPFLLVDSTSPGLASSYQYNTNRENAVYEFAPDRLTLIAPNPGAALTAPSGGGNCFRSNDEQLHYGAIEGTDIIPSYRMNRKETSYVYFDSKTYDHFDPSLGFNGFGTLNHGGLRPYLTSTPQALPAGSPTFATALDALNSWEFVNKDTYQLMCASMDDFYGVVPNDPSVTASPPTPVYFVYPTGDAITLDGYSGFSQPAQLLIAKVNGYQDKALWPAAPLQGQLDNVANFSKGALEDEVGR